MQTLNLDYAETLDFIRAKQLADSVAGVLVDEPMLLSWYDRQRDIESPAGVSECHVGCEVRGCVDYARHRGGALCVDINRGEYLFCYRPLGEFA